MSSSTPPEVPVAVLPGTPGKDYPIKADKLIQIAKKLFEGRVGLADESALADSFRFEFPVVSLPKSEYLNAVRGFGIMDAFPNLQPHAYDWRVDPYEPNRVWFTVRQTATHTGTLKFFLSKYKPTGKNVLGAPECMSFLFDSEGKCTCYTGGYVMDRRVGNTQGLGGMFGILAAIGGPVLKPGGLTYNILFATNAMLKAAQWIFHTFTFGLFKPKPKVA